MLSKNGIKVGFTGAKIADIQAKATTPQIGALLFLPLVCRFFDEFNYSEGFYLLNPQVDRAVFQ